MGILKIAISIYSFPGASDGKESTYKVGDLGSIPGSEKILWRMTW